MPTTSFISANYVARALDYRGPHDWMPNNDATIASAIPEHFLAICQDVVAAGFDAIDIWTAHCHWLQHASEDYLEQVKGFCSQFDLTITSYAGGLEARSAADLERLFKFMKQLGAPLFAGGIHGLPPAQLCEIANDLCTRLNLRYAFENHAEKTYAEIFAQIDNAKHDRVGVALDTGWCGTQGIDAVDATKRLLDSGKLFIVHLKDVKAPGQHDTCTLGDGIVPCEQITRLLARSGWQGDIAIEHEPYDHDPTPEIIESHTRVKQWLKG